jgi:hypothetical protein
VRVSCKHFERCWAMNFTFSVLVEMDGENFFQREWLSSAWMDLICSKPLDEWTSFKDTTIQCANRGLHRLQSECTTVEWEDLRSFGMKSRLSFGTSKIPLPLTRSDVHLIMCLRLAHASFSLSGVLPSCK